MLGALPRGRTSPALPPPPANDVARVEPVPATEPKRGSVKVVVLAVLGIVVGLPILAIVFGPDKKGAETALPPALVAEISDTVSAAEKKDTLSAGSKVDPTPETTTAAEKPVTITDSKVSTPNPLETIALQNPDNSTVRITKTAVNLREGPGTSFPVLMVVQKGMEVAVLEIEAGWSRVRVDEKTSGWMANSLMIDN